jgi:hypothetical protein
MEIGQIEFKPFLFCLENDIFDRKQKFSNFVIHFTRKILEIQ